MKRTEKIGKLYTISYDQILRLKPAGKQIGSIPKGELVLMIHGEQGEFAGFSWNSRYSFVLHHTGIGYVHNASLKLL